MSANTLETKLVHGARLSRRRFLATGSAMAGAMIVGLDLKPVAAESTAISATTMNANLPTSWIEIRADNTILMRTGKCDFGQGSIYTAYPQIVADELDMPFEAITSVIGGDTDRTPDGGGTFGLLRTNVLNLRKAAAYTREAVLEIASEKFGVPKNDLSIENGVVSGGGQSATYGELVKGQDLSLSIPVKGEITDFRGLVVEGEPPLKPASKYNVVGKSYKNPIIAAKVAGKVTWVADVKLPNMLHARVVHPASLGSTLIAAGQINKGSYPTAKVVTVGNLVGVVAESEWEAIQAASELAGSTKWSEWKGLPGDAGLFDYLRDKADWKAVPAAPGKKNRGNAPEAITASVQTHHAAYEVPFVKHAPIGPSMALADVRPDGSVTVHTHSQNPQFLRNAIAKMLDIATAKVVIRTYAGPGHYGRSNGGNAGAEDEAVLLSKELGRPVRVQWMRDDDLKWSTQSPPSYAKIRIGVGRNGKIVGYEADHYAPPMQDDRPIGAILAGLPTIDAPHPKIESRVHAMKSRVADDWVYGAVEHVSEHGHGTWQIGQRESPLNVGLRNHSFRTPVQLQQNFPREVAISEAAALAGIDALQFRIDNTDDERLRDILILLREEAQWQVRASPGPKASHSGDSPVRGRGVSVMFRANAYWACACELAATPATGKISVDKLTIVVDPGIVVNPMQLKRQAEAGALMGLSQALFEEVTFDESGVTNQDWNSYPILTMNDTPEIKVVLAPSPKVDIYGQGSEGANALVPSAVATALFDATGKQARRLPLRPDYVKKLLAV